MSIVINRPKETDLNRYIEEMKAHVARDLNEEWHPNKSHERFWLHELDSKEGKRAIDEFRNEIEKLGWFTYRVGTWLFVFKKPICFLRRLFLFMECGYD